MNWRGRLRLLRTWVWIWFGQTVRTFLQLRERGKVERARRGLGEKRVEVLRPLGPGRFAIFATYPLYPLEGTLIEALRQFSERGVQVLVVATSPLNAGDRATIAQFASAIIDIGNIGRDFGAYQQGVFHLRDTVGLAAVERLVFLNDTLFFLRGRDPGAMIDGLLDEAHDYVGTNENFDKIYHVGSFCFALGRRALNHPYFLRFWQRYMPYSNRVHAIRNGEQGLTATMMAAGFVPYVIYSWHRAADDALTYIRTPDRPDYMICLGLRQKLAAAGDASPEDRAALYYQDHNQVHSLGFFFVRHLGMPYLKRDIVWNNIHLLSDVTSFVTDDQLDDPERVLVMLRQKGLPAARKQFMVRLKSRLQLI